MSRESSAASIIEDTQNLILAHDNETDFFNGFVRHTAAVVAVPASAALCSITLLCQRKQQTVTFDLAQDRLLDASQEVFDEGPAHAAATTGTTINIADGQQESRWPGWPDLLSSRGLKSVLAVPFKLDPDAAAALVLYSTTTDAFGEDIVAATEMFARHTSPAIRLALQMARARNTALDLKSAMASRTTIDLAVGIIMAQNRCRQEDAVRILRSASNNQNLKLREVAASVVSALEQGPPSTHFDH